MKVNVKVVLGFRVGMKVDGMVRMSVRVTE